jgi:hypothetical protein
MEGYWTPDDSFPGKGVKKYHIFLDGTYPSYIDRSTRLVNQNITACLDFNPNYDRPNPYVCHHIKESDIPPTKDSILDVGYFVVSDKLNETAAEACAQLGYHNWYSCNSQTIDANSWYSNSKILFKSAILYDDVFVNDACIT